MYVEMGLSHDASGVYSSIGLDTSGVYYDFGTSIDLGGSYGPSGAYSGACEYISADGTTGTSYDMGIDLTHWLIG